jgi:hypothetical protein
MNFLLFDISPIASPVGIFVGIAIFFIGLAAAVITYKMLKKSVKMAIRIMIVAAILIAALIGMIAFFIFGGGGGNRNRRDFPPTPTPTQRR